MLYVNGSTWTRGGGAKQRRRRGSKATEEGEQSHLWRLQTRLQQMLPSLPSAEHAKPPSAEHASSTCWCTRRAGGGEEDESWCRVALAAGENITMSRSARSSSEAYCNAPAVLPVGGSTRRYSRGFGTSCLLRLDAPNAQRPCSRAR